MVGGVRILGARPEHLLCVRCRTYLKGLVTPVDGRGIPLNLLIGILESLFGGLMAVVSVKVPKWVREKMRAYGEAVEWPEEIRRLIITKIEELERIRAVEKAIKLLEQISPMPKGTAEALVREDRDRH